MIGQSFTPKERETIYQQGYFGKTCSKKRIAGLHRTKQIQLQRHTGEDIKIIEENTKNIYSCP